MEKRKRAPTKPVVINFKVGPKVRVRKGVMDVAYPDMPTGDWAETISGIYRTACTPSVGAKRSRLPSSPS
jgi:hypothetical protein